MLIFTFISLTEMENQLTLSPQFNRAQC